MEKKKHPQAKDKFYSKEYQNELVAKNTNKMTDQSQAKRAKRGEKGKFKYYYLHIN